MAARPVPKLKPAVWDAVVVAMVILAALLTGFRTWGRAADAGAVQVEVSVDGETVDVRRLQDFPEEGVAYSANGYTLYVERETGEQDGVRVSRSDCPSQDCVHTGCISRVGESIVCLPGRISITLKGTASENDVDLILG